LHAVAVITFQLRPPSCVHPCNNAARSAHAKACARSAVPHNGAPRGRWYGPRILPTRSGPQNIARATIV